MKWSADGGFAFEADRRSAPAGRLGGAIALRWGALRVATLAQGSRRIAMAGGPDRDQTDDLFVANEALYQLSYGPVERKVMQTGGSRVQSFFHRAAESGDRRAETRGTPPLAATRKGCWGRQGTPGRPPCMSRAALRQGECGASPRPVQSGQRCSATGTGVPTSTWPCGMTRPVKVAASFISRPK